ncbi:hypothetical protein [Paenibacillus puerhi]|uniref:hypothetical protein n=1 Tax=Paenibacillus puerhi TaxID=2692622 RepID=UPI001356E88C|nr:hypothetical protein [Paenibacillus puerhi]
MLVILVFAGLALLEWSKLKRLKKVKFSERIVFGLVLGVYVIWNGLALTVTWWPNPQTLILYVFGWVDRWVGE